MNRWKFYREPNNNYFGYIFWILLIAGLLYKFFHR